MPRQRHREGGQKLGWHAELPIIGGDGHYIFTPTTFVCLVVEKGLPAVAAFNVRSDGKYINIVCGTGKARSTQGQSSVVPGSFLKIGGGDLFYGEGVGTTLASAPGNTTWRSSAS